MSWYQVAEFPGDEDLSGFSRFLHQQGVGHRVTEEGGRLCLWVHGEDSANQLLQQLKNNPQLHLQFQDHQEPDRENLAAQTLAPGSMALALNIGRFPVTLGLIFLGMLGALLVWQDRSFQWLPWFTAQDFVVSGNRIGFYYLEDALRDGQVWRLITPIFLHFGIFHILFNALWLWEFGRRIEPVLGKTRYLFIITLIAIASNLLQYWWQGPSMFGGLSGVLYGLLGFIWMRQRFYPGELEPLLPSIIGFMLFWLVLCMTGAVNFFISGQVANAAHLGGLITGMLLGFAPIWLHLRNKTEAPARGDGDG